VDDPPVGGAGKIERGRCRKGCGNLGAEYKMPDRESSRLRRGAETRPEVVMGAGGTGGASGATGYARIERPRVAGFSF
jgi:hypothetical protein